MKKLIGLLAFMVLFVWSAQSQNYFDIRLQTSSINCETNEVCYDVQIKSGNERLWRYAGQNYRMFYNGALAEFLRVETVLGSPYAPPSVVQDLQHLDLSDEGNLSFDSDLSWLNYFIDMNASLEGDIISTEVWTTTSRVCFAMSDDVFDEEDICFEMVWAREELTFNYATAFVEVSEWLEPNSTNDHVHGINYHDFDIQSGEAACFAMACGDNPPTYYTRIVLKSTDTLSNISCYAIELSSASARAWLLGDREFSLYFDGSQASFVNASSSLSGSGTLVMGDLLENQVIVDGSGNLDFENNLSYVSFSIDRDTDSLVLESGLFTEVAEICLDFSNGTSGDDCFEIVSARAGLTDSYGSNFSSIYTSSEGELANPDNFIDYNKCNSTPCIDIAAPVSNGDANICIGDDNPALSVQGISGMSVRWYTTPAGGVPVALGEEYTPSGAGIFYAEAFDTIQNCFSNDRTAVALIESPLPTMDIVSKACDDDQSSYALRFTTNASTVESSIGVVEKLVGIEWMISNIPSGTNVDVTLTNNITICARIESIEAPNCDCIAVTAPVSEGNSAACLGSTYPELAVSMLQENMTADWYTSLNGSTPLVTDQLTYTPQNISGTGVYTYFVQARSLENGCTSATRTEIVLTVLDPPVYAFVDSECSADLATYTSTIYTDATSVESDSGTVVNVGSGIWRIESAPKNTNITLSLFSSTGCTMTRAISAPSCGCDVVEAPICDGEFVICEGEDYDGFSAFAVKNYETRWYDAETEGTLLAEGHTFKPNLAGTYYAEAVNTVTGCVSQERTAVSLTINAVPDLELVFSVLCAQDTFVWADLVIDANATEGSIAVFTSFRDALSNENALADASFVVNEIGSYFIRKTTDGGCFDIETIIVIPEDCGNQCLADAGQYSPTEEICFDGAPTTISAMITTDPVIPTGYLHAFFISQNSNKDIFGVSADPEYIIEAPGTYRIHSVVFKEDDMTIDSLPDEVTSIDGVEEFITLSGSCISLDTEGALFEVAMCTDACLAFAPSPLPRDIDCLDDGPVTLGVEMNPIELVIPDGYTQVFVLTSGTELTILGATSDTFSVEVPGQYQVHSLVFDPLTLDMGIITPGVTTAFEVFNMLIEGGGDICASLDIIGAQFVVEGCSEMCDADAGNTEINGDNCLSEGESYTIVSSSTGSIIPAGFSQMYVMTSGDQSAIMDVQMSEFSVSTSGSYSIHSFVFDPLTFDFSSITLGETTTDDIQALLIQGGGSICGSLDISGSSIDVIPCTDMCLAFSGNTVSDGDVCLDGSSVALAVSLSDDTVIPDGYVQSFITTQGSSFIVIGLQSEPFLVDSVGSYEVNSIVYDTSTFDVNSIVFGETDFFDVYNLFEEGGGDLCGSLEFFGTTFDVDSCIEECDVLLEDIIYTVPTCFDSSSSVLSQISFDDNNSIIPFDEGYEIIQLVSQNGIVVSISGEATPSQLTAGSYSVHSLVFNPVSFSETEITTGVTTVTELSARFISGGGDLCGALELNGFLFDLEYCSGIGEMLIDLFLEKNISNVNPSVGEEVTFSIDVTNNAEHTATGVAIADRLPNGYALTGNISDNGISNTEDDVSEILWSDLTVQGISTVRLTFTAIVNPIDADVDYKNVAEVVAADQDDRDSSPNNDDGDQSEDDEASVTPNVSDANIDLELIKISSLSAAGIGDQVRFNINLTNRSMAMATGIEIVDIIPDGIDTSTISNISNNGVYTDGQVVWSNLELGFLSNVNLSFTANISEDAQGSIKNIAQVTKADQQDADSTPDNDDGDQSEDDEDFAMVNIASSVIDLSLEKIVNNPTPIPGEMVTFQILVSNDGTIPATGISVADMIPMMGYDLGTIANMSPAGQIIGNTIVWSVDEILPSDDAAFSFDIAVLPDGDNYKNIAQVTAADQLDADSTPNNDDGDQSEDDEDSAMVTPILSDFIVDLSVSKSVSDLQPQFGDEVTYQITISNDGPFEATNVVLRDVPPDAIDAFDITGPQSLENGEITWTIPVIDVGETMTFEYSSIVFESMTSSYTNVVQVMSADQDDIDSTPGNDDGDQSEDDEASATIFPVANSVIDLELEKKVNNACASMSDRVSFELTLTNNSDAIATNVSVRDVMSAGFMMIADISNGGESIGNNITWSGLSLLPQEVITLSYSAMINPVGMTFTNTAQVIAADQDDVDSTPNNDDGDQSEDDEAAITLNPNGDFDLELTKVVDNPFAQPEARVRFDITVHNVGCQNATGVAIQDILPSGYKQIRNITDLGVRDGNVVTWTGLNIASGTSKTVSFTAEVVHFMINCDYVNVAEIIAADQTDIDSTPDNDDGDQSEDDEDSAEVIAGSMADVELSMVADRTEAITGDTVNCVIKVCNNGPANARGVQIKDYLPEGVQVVGDLNYKGEQVGNEITWSNFTIVAGDCIELNVSLEVMGSDATRTITSTAEVVLADQVDPDSSPGNGVIEEDDMDAASMTHLVPIALPQVADVANMVEIKVNTGLFLEGAFNPLKGDMNTTLNKLGYLPGQKPSSFFAEGTPAGQPYKGAPWYYDGSEGLMYDQQNGDGFAYPQNTVDWVLISIRTEKSAETVVATRAALLMKDGSIQMPPDTEPIILNADMDYYLVVQHRNHLPIMSPQKLEIDGYEIAFDFRNNESYTGLLGSGQKDIYGTYCVYAANGDQFSETLSAYDINVRDIEAWHDNNGLNSAYLDADYDLNGDVNVNDQIMWLFNNGVFSDVPR